MVRGVFFLRFLPLCFLAASVSGCAFFYSLESEKRYSLVRVTNIEGQPTAEWIAEGFVTKTPVGYKFKAVARLSGPPFQQEMHYPYRRQVEVGGVNIVVSRCGKPLWLYRIEGR